MIETAVEAPGEAPSNAASEPSAAVTISVPNSRTPPFQGPSLPILPKAGNLSVLPACLAALAIITMAGNKTYTSPRIRQRPRHPVNDQIN
ncbi:hypothetical protein [Dyadobacter sp. CY347]|uniref:hypothetical protein n=1 Tax=Dyadobacter sp. CY347 TaxID=2909336 RepID=UPI0038D3EBC2